MATSKSKPRRTGRIPHGGTPRARIMRGAATKTALQTTGDHTSEREQKSKLPATYTRPDNMISAKAKAIDGMREHGVIAEACRASRIGRQVLLEEMKTDAAFRRAMKHAHAECMDELERAMIERGRYSRGDLAGIFVLKHNRLKYREDKISVEHTGKDGGPILHAEVKDELLRRLDKLADAMATDAVVVGSKRGPALVSEGDGARRVKRVAGSTGSDKPKRGVRVG